MIHDKFLRVEASNLFSSRKKRENLELEQWIEGFFWFRIFKLMVLYFEGLMAIAADDIYIFVALEYSMSY